MPDRNLKAILVGDNPFLGVSHFSQEKARGRLAQITQPQHAAEILRESLHHGANGFLFSVADPTLSIVRLASRQTDCPPFDLHAIVPYSYEYVRLSVSRGGIPGLAREVSRQVLQSRNVPALTTGLRGAVTADPGALCQAYVHYSVGLIRTAMGKRATLASVLLHEIVTDMALALGWDWLFSAFIDGVTALGVRPGFNTRNLPRLVRQLQDWRISTRDLAFAAPFNSVGFQMCPSRAACEDALATIPEAFVIAISVLAAGYLQPAEAAAYTASLPNLSGVALGVSRIDYARESFTAFDASVKKQSAA